jgi:DNA-binding NtrC family response regulator
VNLRLAPLRERKEDIPPLIAHFLRRYGNGHTLTEEASAAMLEYEWPGNVRELENAVQHMVALNSGPLLDVRDLPSSIQNSRLRLKMDAGPSAPDHDGTSPILPLTELERRAIIQALEYTRGDRAVAANLLGIGRTTLYRKLKEYSIPADGQAPA